MFDTIVFLFKLLFQLTDSMIISTETLFAISLSVNVCVFIFCACSRLQSCLRRKCCCGPNNYFVTICQSYHDRTEELSKSVTEQIAVVLLSILAVICICSTNLIRVPFSDHLDSNEKTLIQIVLAINVGRYVYLIFQDAYLFSHIDRAKFRTDIIHHSVTLVCYCVMLVYQQNMLLGMLGILTEVNTIVIEITKVMKTLRRHKTGTYKKMSVLSCAVTIVFRAAIPVLFLIMGMFHETPFVMHYTALTVFFLSIIFFSVINVWLVLSTFQRVLKIYGHTGSSSDSHRRFAEIQLQDLDSFHQNNLGYERPLGNININNINYDDEKLNINKKYMPKTNIKNVYLVNDTERASSESSSDVQLEANTQSQEDNTFQHRREPSLLSRSGTERSSQSSVSLHSCSVLLSNADANISTEIDLSTPDAFNFSNSVLELRQLDLSRSLSENLPSEQSAERSNDSEVL